MFFLLVNCLCKIGFQIYFLEQSNTSVVIDTNLYDRDPAKGDNIAFKLLSMNTGPYQPKNIEFSSHNGRKFLQRWYIIYN